MRKLIQRVKRVTVEKTMGTVHQRADENGIQGNCRNRNQIIEGSGGGKRGQINF